LQPGDAPMMPTFASAGMKTWANRRPRADPSPGSRLSHRRLAFRGNLDRAAGGGILVSELVSSYRRGWRCPGKIEDKFGAGRASSMPRAEKTPASERPQAREQGAGPGNVSPGTSIAVRPDEGLFHHVDALVLPPPSRPLAPPCLDASPSPRVPPPPSADGRP
jgi:hypothetical protein